MVRSKESTVTLFDIWLAGAIITTIILAWRAIKNRHWFKHPLYWWALPTAIIIWPLFIVAVIVNMMESKS